jgi:hypothetical protein
MRRFQLLTVAALALCAGTAANAQDTMAPTPSRSSEFFHAPGAGMSEVTVHGGYALGTVRAEGAGTEDVDVNGVRNLGVEYVYGINDMFKVGADISYTNVSTGENPDTESSGIEPITIKGSGNYQLGMGTLVYGLRAQFAVAKAKVEDNGDTNRTVGDILSNYSEGGFELAPFVGYSMLLGEAHTVGAKLSYEVINTDTDVESATGDFTLSGGSEGALALFYEYNLSGMPLGAALTYDWYTAIDAEAAGVENQFADARSMFGVNLYTSLMTGNVAIIPMLTWREKASSDDFDKLSDVRLNVAARFGF